MFGLANPSASPSLEYVHASAGLSRRFRTWFDKACKNYGELLELGGVVDNVLRRERREELTGEEKTKFTDALMKYEKLEDGLAKFVTSKPYVDFVGATDEDLIKWVGDEIFSLGYCGFRERSSQYWLWDYRAEKLPYEKKVRQIFDFYDVEHRMRIPSQEQAEAMLFEFLENIKKWRRTSLVWVVRNVYPLSDSTGGFWVVVRKVMELESLRDVWEDIIEDWKRWVVDDLKKTPEFEVLKAVLMAEWEAERYLKHLADELEKEFLKKYGTTTADVETVKEEFYDRAPELLKEKVVSEEKLREVYEQIKPIAPEKAELKKAGLWKAIRWAFLHPEMRVDAFASVHVFPLDFTTEEAMAIASKIMEKVAKKPPVVAPPPPPPPPVVLPVVPFEERVEKLISALKDQTGIFSWETIERIYGLSFTDDERDRIKRYWIGRFPPNTEITVQWGITIPPPKIPVVAPPVVMPPVPVKVALKPEERGRLADFFFIVKLSRAGVSVPLQYRPEFERVLDVAKTYDENLAILEKVADDIIKRE